MGTAVPAVIKEFPDAVVEVDMYSSAAPVAGINPQNLTESFVGFVVFRARLSNRSLAHLSAINDTAKITLLP